MCCRFVDLYLSEAGVTLQGFFRQDEVVSQPLELSTLKCNKNGKIYSYSRKIRARIYDKLDYTD